MPRLTINGNAREAIRAAAAMQNAIEKAGKSAGIATGKLDKMTRAARTIREANNPQLRYNRLLDKTAKLVTSNKLKLEDATAAAIRYGRALDRATGKGRPGGGLFRGGGGVGGFAGGVGGRVATGLGAYASIASVVALVRREFRRMEEFENARVDTQRVVSLSNQRLAQNISSYTAEERAGLKEKPRSLAIEQGLPVARLKQSMASVISATGKPEVAKDIVDVTIQVSRDKEEQGDISGGIGDVLFNAPKIKNAIEGAGFLFGIQQAARMESPGLTARGLGPVLGAFRPAAGATAAQGGAMYAAISRGASDKYGNLSATAVASFPGRLRRWFEQTRTNDFSPEEMQGFTKQWNILRNPKYEDIKEQFLKDVVDVGFKAKVRPGFERLLGRKGHPDWSEPDQEIVEVYEKTLGLVDSPEKMLAIAKQAILDANMDANVITDRVEGRIASAFEGFQLDTEAKVSSEGTRKVVDLLAVAQGNTFSEEDLGKLVEKISNFTRAELLDYVRKGRLEGAEGRAARDARRTAPDSFYYQTGLLPPMTGTSGGWPRSKQRYTLQEEMRADQALKQIESALIDSQRETTQLQKNLIEEAEQIKKERSAEGGKSPAGVSWQESLISNFAQTEQGRLDAETAANEHRSSLVDIAKESRDISKMIQVDASETNKKLLEIVSGSRDVSSPNKAE